MVSIGFTMLQPKPLRPWRRTLRLLKSRVAKFTQMTISVQEILTIQEARTDERTSGWQSIQRELFLERGHSPRFDEERRFWHKYCPLF